MAKQITEILKKSVTLSVVEGQDISMPQPIKTTQNPSKLPSLLGEGLGDEGKESIVTSSVVEKQFVDYNHALAYLQSQGIKYFGSHFKIHEEDKPLLCKLLCYFLRDVETANELGINLNKGILLTGPVGCGKTSIMFLMRFFLPLNKRYIMRPCRDISFEFIKHGYDTIHKYSTGTRELQSYWFDDLGIENNLKFYGNECNLMAEILLSRYDLFVSRKLLTHITTNLSASEIEEQYGNRVRSRMREMFNLAAFPKNTFDKRT